MQTNHAYYFCLNILNTFYNLSVALGSGKGKGVNIFGEINLVQTIWLLCPSCIVSLTSSLLRISFSVCLVRLTAFLWSRREFTIRLEARRTESISNRGELSDCIQNLLWATSSELTVGLSLLSCLQMGKENLNSSSQLFTSKISEQPLIFGSFAPLGWGWESKSYGKLKSH